MALGLRPALSANSSCVRPAACLRLLKRTANDKAAPPSGISSLVVRFPTVSRIPTSRSSAHRPRRRKRRRPIVSSDFDTTAATAEEAEVIDAAIEYYQYVEVGDYYSTCYLLSYEDQNYYTQDQWVAANN